MESRSNDSEGKYAQKSHQGTYDDNIPMANQLSMATQNEVQSSGNGTPTDDLLPALDRSLMVTPNTIQDWTNEENVESTTHQDEAIHKGEDTIKKYNLENVSQHFMYLENVDNTEKHTETITEDSSLEKSEHNLVTECQSQGMVYNFIKEG
jgi:hypothetical protein